MSVFHTKIGPALLDPSSWASFVAGAVGYAALPAPFNYIAVVCSIPGILLRGNSAVVK